MLDFMCKKLEIEDIIRCSFALSKSEYQILIFLLKQNKFLNAKEIKDKLNVDLTTAQRSLKKLHEKNLLLRQQKNIQSGGYVFCYKIKSKDILKIKIKEIIESWSKNVESSIDRW